MVGNFEGRLSLQFGLKSLLLLTVILAVSITWWRQWKQNAELMAMQVRLQELEAESEYQRCVNRVLSRLDLENLQHRQAFKLLRHMSGWQFDSLQQKTIGDLEVLLFHSAALSIPGSQDSVAAVLRDDHLIDLVVRESDTRKETHDLEFQNTHGDVEIVFVCRPGIWSDSKPISIEYRISESGFAKIE